MGTHVHFTSVIQGFVECSGSGADTRLLGKFRSTLSLNHNECRSSAEQPPHDELHQARRTARPAAVSAAWHAGRRLSAKCSPRWVSQRRTQRSSREGEAPRHACSGADRAAALANGSRQCFFYKIRRWHNTYSFSSTVVGGSHGHQRSCQAIAMLAESFARVLESPRRYASHASIRGTAFACSGISRP